MTNNFMMAKFCKACLPKYFSSFLAFFSSKIYAAPLLKEFDYGMAYLGGIFVGNNAVIKQVATLC